MGLLINCPSTLGLSKTVSDKLLFDGRLVMALKFVLWGRMWVVRGGRAGGSGLPHTPSNGGYLERLQ